MKLLSNIRAITNAGGSQLVGICPGCKREGNLKLLGQDLGLQIPIASSGSTQFFSVGHRQCPNQNCSTHLFVVYEGSNLLWSFPAGRIDFDITDVPSTVVKSFDEALTCAANGCHVAAAMLIRKTLEEVCEDRGAEGDNLKERIGSLRTKLTLPNELFEAMDHLRLLGNDAAHIEAKTYDDIGLPETTTSIELTKEIIKSTYQYKALLAKLQLLMKSKSTP